MVAIVAGKRPNATPCANESPSHIIEGPTSSVTRPRAVFTIRRIESAKPALYSRFRGLCREVVRDSEIGFFRNIAEVVTTEE
jgi:hypothetical protein